MIYFLNTILAMFLDLVVIIIGLGKLGEQDGKSYDTVFVFLLGVLFYFIAFFFVGKIISIRQRLPEYAKTVVTMSLLGMFKKLTLALEVKR